MLIPSADSYEPLELAYAGLITALTSRGAAAWEHPGGTLLAHSLRTARRLEAWGASRELITAGLCHAAYGTAGYPRPLFALADRARLREDIGDELERHVFMEQIGHAIDEDSPWLHPAQWIVETILVARDIRERAACIRRNVR